MARFADAEWKSLAPQIFGSMSGIAIAFYISWLEQQRAWKAFRQLAPLFAGLSPWNRVSCGTNRALFPFL
jgi:hypothetical protein